MPQGTRAKFECEHEEGELGQALTPLMYGMHPVGLTLGEAGGEVVRWLGVPWLHLCRLRSSLGD